MVQQLQTLLVIPKDSGSIFSTHGRSKLSATPVPGYLTLSHEHTCRLNINAYKIKINEIIFKIKYISLFGEEDVYRLR